MPTKHEIIALHKAHPDWTSPKLAKALGCKRQQITVVLSKNGYALPCSSRKHHRIAAIRAGYEENLTPSEIAKRIGSTADSVRVSACTYGVNHDRSKAGTLRIARRVAQMKAYAELRSITHPEAKASEDNGQTSAAAGALMTGEVSRPASWRSDAATSERTDATAGRDRHNQFQPSPVHDLLPVETTLIGALADLHCVPTLSSHLSRDCSSRPVADLTGGDDVAPPAPSSPVFHSSPCCSEGTTGRGVSATPPDAPATYVKRIFNSMGLGSWQREQNSYIEVTLAWVSILGSAV